jgi:deoxycytidylate deaminase
LKIADSSTYGNFHHGAVLARGGSIISLGVNSGKYCSDGENYRCHGSGKATYHAEISALLHLSRNITKGSTMYVARCSRTGDGSSRMSKPCSMCHAVMKERGVKKVFYTIDDEVIGTYKL